VGLVLLEARDSPFRPRIEHAACEAGLSVEFVEGTDDIPRQAALVGVGPSVRDPLHVARHLRRVGAQPLLLLFCGSRSACDTLQAELVRDPFVYPRYELIQLPDSPRQLASRMGRVVAQVKRQYSHSVSTRRRRRRTRAAPPQPSVGVGSEHYLAQILEQANDAIFSTDPNGRVTSWNTAAQRLFGFESRAVLGLQLDFLNVPQAAADDQLGAVVRRVLVTGTPEQRQLVRRTPAGGIAPLAVSVAPVRDGQGTLLGLSVVARDNTDYQRMEEALRDANLQKDEFLAIMSHELRTPLTSILGYTDVLLRGLSGPLAPLTNKYIGNVRAAGDRLLELVNGLLDYTRLEAGVERLDLQPVDLPALVSQTVEHCENSAKRKGIDVQLVVADQVDRVDADRGKLTHVLRNLLSNAVKFTPGGGWVAVRVGPDPETNDAVRVSVADSGIGLREEQVPRVWERFYQGDASLTRPYGGMGLGLSIARHLVALHGGTVGATSRGPGMGSTFWFSLPLGRARG
jgi:PAS domain S-box-containing protein